MLKGGEKMESYKMLNQNQRRQNKEKNKEQVQQIENSKHDSVNPIMSKSCLMSMV